MQPLPSEPRNFCSNARRGVFRAAISSQGKALSDKMILDESKCASRKEIHGSIQIANVACTTRESRGCEAMSRNMSEGSGKDRAFSGGEWGRGFLVERVVGAAALWNGTLIV